MEHLSTFKLTRDPFANEPQLAFYYESPVHQDVERRLERAAMQNKGLSVVTGAGGVGKTLLVRHMIEELPEEVFETCLLVPIPGITDGHWILDRFARQLGVEEPADDSQGLMAQLYEQLAIVREDGRHTVLIFDEAQVLAEQGLLGELRGLLNLEYEERRMLSMILVGLPSLGQALPEEPALSDRVDLRIELGALDPTYAAQYLTHRILSAGGNPAILEAAAVDALIKESHGVARHLNSLADNALFEAHLAGRVSASAADVQRAAADLGLFADDDDDAGQAPTQGAAAPRPLDVAAMPEFPAAPAPSEPAEPPALELEEVVATETNPLAGALVPDDGEPELEFGPGAPGSPRPENASHLILGDEEASDGELDNLFADLVEE